MRARHEGLRRASAALRAGSSAILAAVLVSTAGAFTTPLPGSLQPPAAQAPLAPPPPSRPPGPQALTPLPAPSPQPPPAQAPLAPPPPPSRLASGPQAPPPASSAQRPAQPAERAQAPVFKSGVELITVDVTVVDKTGLPVRSLRADQFEVTVDGRPRRVASAELVDHAVEAVTTADRAQAAERWQPDYSSNEAGRSASPGRLIFIVVDQGSFRPAGARGATEAARRFIDRLQPADRVGLLAFPPPGPSIAASRNHAQVRAALGTVIGSGEPLRSLGSVQVGLAEGLDIAANDPFAFASAVERECSGLREPELTMCKDQVQQAARWVEQVAQVRARDSLHGIRAVVDGLASIPERKTLALISGGFPSSDRVGGRLNVDAEIGAIARDAEKANANLYVLHLDTAFLEAFSAESRWVSSTLTRDAALLASGLENIASGSGGTVFKVVAGADTAFERVLRETSASYILGLEPTDADRDGKPHAIRVNLRLPGVQVRSRREFMLPKATTAAASADPLLAALAARRAVTALSLGLSTHSLGADPAGGLRVLVTANVGRNLSGRSQFKMALVVTDATGRVVFASPASTEELEVPAGNTAGSASYLATIRLPAGDYNLRLAAVDSDGRAGSVDHAFTARLANGEGITMSDLLLLHSPLAQNVKPAAVADGRLRAGLVSLHMEVQARSGSLTPSVTFGVADTPDGAPLIQGRAAMSKKDAKGRSTADGVLDLGLLPPGDYYAVATVSDGKRRLGNRFEPIRVEARAVRAEAAAPDGEPRVRFFLGDAAALVKKFSRADVLAPAATRFFADRLLSADKDLPPGAAQALNDYRSGRFDAIRSVLRETPSDRLSVAFLKGIALLDAGELEPAAREFREAIRIADDFLPAAFYLGACYAEGGRDEEAVGAWQTALVTEADARIVYDVLADALLRLDDAEQAVQVVNEALGRWPDDDGFLPRLAVGEAMAGQRAEALATLDRYLARRRTDAEAAALAIRLIYEAHAAGQTITTLQADRDAAARYGESYRAAGGRSPLVDRWLSFIAKM